MTPETLLSSASISIAGHRIINDATLVVAPGEVVQIHGQNGAGKSTLLSAIAGYTRLEEGSRGDIVPRPGTRDHQIKVGYQPANTARLPHCTIQNWCWLIANRYNIPNPTINGLWGRLGGRSMSPKTLLSDLSTGNLKKALFLSAIALKREILLLDEPFESIDGSGISVMEELISAQRDAGAQIVLVSHRELGKALPLSSSRTILDGHLTTGRHA